MNNKAIIILSIILLVLSLSASALAVIPQISPGDYHTVILKADGSLWSCGKNYYGELGYDTSTIDQYAPLQIGKDFDWISVASGGDHTIALKSDGTLWGWGSNSYGQLGEAPFRGRSYPARIGSDNDWIAIAVGGYHTLALKSDGTLWGWGDNWYGQVGRGTEKDNVTAPTKIGNDNDWTAIAASGQHSLALKSNGTLWAWGYNE